MYLYIPTSLLCFYSIVSVTLAASPCVPEQPANSSLPCGVAVDLPSDVVGFYQISSPQLVATVAECADLCARRSPSRNQYLNDHYLAQIYCVSFAYTSSDGFCQLISERISPMDYQRDSSSDTKLYDINCFNCGPRCPQPFGNQLLDNGGFEQQDLGPWSSFEGAIATGKHSARMFQCRSRNPFFFSDTLESICQIQQAFNKCPGALYSLSFDYKLPANGTELRGIFVFYQSFSHQAVIPAGTSEPSWRSFQIFFSGVFEKDYSSDGNPLAFEFFHPKNSNITDQLYDLDNVRVVRVNPNIATKPGASSIITNGGFEDGKLTPWTLVNPQQSPAYKVVSPGLGSHNALKIFYVPRSYYYPFHDEAPLIFQTITTKPGRQYLLTFDYKSPQPVVTLSFSTASTPGVDPANSTSISVEPHARKKGEIFSISYPFVAYDRFMNLSISIEKFDAAFNNVNISSILIDNISVKQISKPIV